VSLAFLVFLPLGSAAAVIGMTVMGPIGLIIVGAIMGIIAGIMVGW